MPWSARASSMPWAIAGEVLGVGQADRGGVVGRGDQLDVDRALRGAARQVLVGDVAVVLRRADDAGGEVVGRAGSAGSRSTRTSSSVAKHALGQRRCRCAAARRRISAGGAVPSRWTCSSALGITRSLTARPPRRRLVSRRLVADARSAARSAALAASAPPRPRGVDDGQRAVAGPTSRADRRDRRSSPTAWSITSSSRPRPPPRSDDGEAERRACHARSRRPARSGVDRARSPARRRGARRVAPAGRPGRRARRPSRRSARPRRRSAAPARPRVGRRGQARRAPAARAASASVTSMQPRLARRAPVR